MSSAPLFSDRTDAGEQLGQLLLTIITEQEACIQPIVYALPRGGIPVAAPVARLLGCPLDIVVAKKITAPQNPELAIGAVTAEGQVLWSRQRFLERINSNWRETALHQAQEKARSQLTEFAVGRPQVNPKGTLALVVDDGIATGMTIAAATQALRTHHPAQIWICAPVAPDGLLNWLTRWCDRLVVLQAPEVFLSVSRFYVKFPQVDTQEALVYLKQHNFGIGEAK
ncbi:MAG TPA: phosphoribosyltransferase [Cyanobacteria bacterium UBA8803]|nr:phosphoribosyltransferase [Cyanobacteria bacterium UBA9273]HBL61248.1 phosphoribosyltransferase [Cyanobacteria bacterium UBA8803]